jgi:predicted peptidase
MLLAPHAFPAVVRRPLMVLVLLILVLAPASAAVAVAGGQITPVSAPGAGYVNDNTHPFPYLVFLPNGYSASGGPYPLVLSLHGNGEVGNGSSDGTLAASAGNQLGYLFANGPLPLIRNGSTYFGDRKVIVVQPQSNLGGGAAFNAQRLDATMRHLLATYQIDGSRIYAMGLSAGGGGIVRFAYHYGATASYRLAVIVPFANIEGLGTTYTDFSRFAGAITWFIGCSDDGIAPPILVSGRIWGGYGEGFAGGISRYIEQAAKGGAVPASSIRNRCISTHPDLAAIAAGGFNANGTIPAAQLTGTRTARFDPASTAGWSWVADQVFTAGSRLQVTIRDGGGHSGWSQTMGTGSAPNLPFWNWLLAQRLGQAPTGYGAGSPSGAATAIALSPVAATLTVGQSRQFSAIAVDDAGAAISPQPTIVWTSGSGGTITGSGLFTATTATDAVVVTATVAGASIARTATVTLAIRGSLQVRPVDTTQPRPPFGYVAYVPEGYSATGSRLWPLVVHLPHTSEAGDGTNTSANGSQLYTRMVRHGPLHQVASLHWDFPAIIIAPQVATNWTKPLNVKNVVEYAKANYRVDADRLYMTGQLEGANGTLRYAVAYPRDLAAILPIEAGTPSSAAQAAAIRAVPLWAVHCFADPQVARGISIGWIDAVAAADQGGGSDVMAGYPGYGGDRNRFAVDCDATSGKPLDPDGDITTIANATCTSGSAAIAFPAGVAFGSSIFGLWSGSDAQPFARVTVAGEPAVHTAARSYPTSLNLTAKRTTATTTATVSIRTPVGYNATAYRQTDGTWAWSRRQLWDGADPDQQVLTLFYHQRAEIGWSTTWANWNVWNWMFSHTRAPMAAG